MMNVTPANSWGRHKLLRGVCPLAAVRADFGKGFLILLVLVCVSVEPVHAQEPKPGESSADGPPPEWVELLRKDPRLRATVTMTLSAPTVHSLLDLLSKSTGVPLSMTPMLEQQQPIIGSLSMYHSRVWQVMSIVATRSMVKGRWEAMENGGYRLAAARPVAVKRRTIAKEERVIVPPESPVRRWLAITWVVLLAILGILGLLRWRQATTTPSPEIPEAQKRQRVRSTLDADRRGR